MEKYDSKKIEKKWQDKWEKNPSLYAADEKSDKDKFYCLDMFPYPSGDGLHVGHVESYTATDIISRYLRMKGKNVLHPQGWDAFGLPAENYAIKTKTHPSITTKNAIENFKKQIKILGFSYDWSREINSSDPEYYKWTQWFFLLLYKNGLAYKKKAKVNWCPKCQTVLANEQAEGGFCERCETEVMQKDLEQWFFKITDFAEDLLSGLENLNWPESTKAAQRNWIGKSEGVEFEMKIKDSDENIEVYTTRLDTVFGMTYTVVAPEHTIIEKLKNKIENKNEVEKYIADARKKTELERTVLQKYKTGVELKGIKAVNPFTNEEIPVYVADYVLVHYGTGAVMAVPAHDERDFEFAKKYKLPIKQSIAPDYENYKITINTLEALDNIYNEATKKDVKFWVLGGLACAFYANIIYRRHYDIDLIAKDENNREKLANVLEGIGFKKIGEKKLTEKLTNFIYKRKDVEIDLGPNEGEFGLASDFENDIKSLGKYKLRVLSERFIKSFKKNQLQNRDEEKDKIDFEYLNGKVFVDNGVLVNSEKYDGLTSGKAREEMTKWLEKEKIGNKKINYKLRDWLVSRQRYWGAPIPIIYCDKCGEVPVPEKDLPVELPTDVDFKPTGESPLNYSKKFQDVKCQKCGGKARRESDTMDTFVCSSWYYFRYADPKNEKEFAFKEQIKKWLPVDLYVGGAEHTVLHLLYARFFTKVLKRLKYIDFEEPFKKLRHQGIILAEDGNKMSKSKGNVVNPDDVVKEYGADALRLFEMFMGPLEDAKPWNTKGIVGMSRFLDRIWRLQFKIKSAKLKDSNKNSKLISLINKTIKKVSEDLENLRYNTVISALMILANELEKQKEILITDYELLIILVSPFAPHVSEELWEKLGHNESIFKEKWPEHDPELVKDEEIELVIQVNGKLRDRIKVLSDISEDDAKKTALESEKVKNHISDKKIKKVIFVKGKLINIVI